MTDRNKAYERFLERLRELNAALRPVVRTAQTMAEAMRRYAKEMTRGV